METSLQRDLSHAAKGRSVTRLILVGNLSEHFSLLMKAWLDRRRRQNIRCFVVDTSPDGAVQRAASQLPIPESARSDFSVLHTVGTDDDTCNALSRLLRNSDRGAQASEVILQLTSDRFPEVDTACKHLATRWFRGKGPRTQLSWAYYSLPLGLAEPSSNLIRKSPEHEHSVQANDGDSQFLSTSLEHLRNCLVTRKYPRRPSILLIGNAKESIFFLSELLQLSSWISFVQVAEPDADLEECWTRAEQPDLVFSDESSFKFLVARRACTNSVWVLATNDHQRTSRAVSHFVDPATRPGFPEVIVSWTRETADEVTPLWVTRPLARNMLTLPSADFYEPPPELKQVREQWQTGASKIVVLVGYGGVGKTVLAQHLVESINLTASKVNSDEPKSDMATADALFVWDFYAEPFSETFLRSFTKYLDPESKVELHLDECLPRIRNAIISRNLRRVLLVMDGLEAIQRVRGDANNEGEIQDGRIRDLLIEIGLGFLPIVALITTRLKPAALQDRVGQGLVQIELGPLPLHSAQNLLRASGGFAASENLTPLAERFRRHAMSLYHAGRVISDFHNGDLTAANRLPRVEVTLKQSNVKEIDQLNRGFIELFAHYEEYLSTPDRAILQRLALVGPMSTRQFTEIFAESKQKQQAGPLAGLRLGEIHSRFESLTERRLLDVHISADDRRYATHPTLSYYFGNTFAAEIEALSIGARDYYERQLAAHEAADQSSTHANIRTDGAVRARRAAVGPRDNQVYRPISPILLDLFERIIKHTILSGRTEEARLYYHQRLGDQYLESIGEGDRARRVNYWLKGDLTK